MERSPVLAIAAVALTAAAALALTYKIDHSGGATVTAAALPTQAAADINKPAPAKTRSQAATAKPSMSPRSERLTIPAGSTISARMMTHVSSRAAAPGDLIEAQTTENLTVDGKIIVPAGTPLRGRVTEVRPAAETKSKAVLSVRFDQIGAHYGKLSLVSPDLEKRARAANTAADVALVAGGATAGAVIGHQVDGDKGKEIGAIAGAVLGGVTAANLGANVQLKADEQIVLRFDERMVVTD